MKKLAFLLMFVFTGIGVSGNNKSIIASNNSLVIEKYSTEVNSTEEDCRKTTAVVITFLHNHGNMSLQELSDLEVELLMNCFEAM